ncbi:uncharacterized protein LOC754646 isoform X2 [Strongylocentrotus purpuratus]|uniref:Uncharacterized protein n=1 Tax=Strongylocentrotus purpuratus TaxID=7668 RepID=A0A7M7SY36_STRPU|nr:uncharacterized protein LOC754646 isoform X2 [Strongylocentrotus purpuratus]
MSDGSQHVDIASTVYPSLGLTSDQDHVYQEYLILQAKAVGIDGFMIEWGYMDHSSDRALKSYLTLAQRHTPFKLAVNWCDHWLASELKNKSSQEVIDVFHSNLQYLMDTMYSSPLALYHHGNPVIFWFGGGLTSGQFRALLSMPITLPPGAKPPIWIGSFLKFVATPELWEEWGNLLNGTFGWSPHGMRPTPANMSEWDFYGTVDDAVEYQRNVSKFGERCLSSGSCVLWCGSASPGFDNRGCAGWGRELRYLPRLDINNQSRSTYDSQWKYHLSSNTSAEYIIIPTMNDFPEATPLLDINASLSSLYSTLIYASRWKDHSYDVRGLILCPVWYRLYKEMQFYNMTPGINVQSLEDSLQAAKLAISQGTQTSLSKAWILIQNAKDLLDSMIKSDISEDEMKIPVPSSIMSFSLPPIIENGSYIINHTSPIYLHMAEETASILRQNNFKGLLRFQYQPLTQGINYIRVISSSETHTSDPSLKYTFHSKGLAKESKRSWRYTVKSDRSEVCKIHVNGTGKGGGAWQNATVAMYKENQSWDHSATHESDLVFISLASYAVRNISLQFTVFSKR